MPYIEKSSVLSANRKRSSSHSSLDNAGPFGEIALAQVPQWSPSVLVRFVLARVLVFVNVCLDKVGHFTSINLSTFAVADLNGRKKGKKIRS